MKHPASTAALLLLGLAFLVGGATWLLTGSEADDGQLAQAPPTAASSQVGFEALTPKEQRKKLNMERTQRDLKQIREVGKQVGEDLYMIPDATGNPVYYKTELIKGRGRNGEPLYLSEQIVKTRTLKPLDASKYRAPESPKLKAKPMKGVLKAAKSQADESGPGPKVSGGTGEGDGGGNSEDGAQAPTKTKGG